MRLLKYTVLVPVLALVLIAAPGCEKKSDTEKAMDKTGDAIKDAADKTGDAAKKAGEATKDAAKDAADKAKAAVK
jgi:hypothetical protein